MYGYDRRALRAVIDATADVDADPAVSFYEAWRLTAQIGADRIRSFRGDGRAGHIVPTGRPRYARTRATEGLQRTPER
jgi:hypothetical protein